MPGRLSVPYCGAAALPETLWSRWNLDPVLLAALVACACAYAVGASRLKRRARALDSCAVDTRALGLDPLRPGEQAAFYAGWALTAGTLISPLCALSVSLFAARIGQHMVLALFAAPLVAIGRPMTALGALLGERRPRKAGSLSPLLAAGVYAALLWVWHAPAAYDASFRGWLVYWLMHVTLFGVALWLWHGLLDRSLPRAAAVVGAGVISSAQMGLLGAVITLAPRPLYAPHALTTAAWGLTPLQDQQLGGAIMWVPGCLVFLAAAMTVLWLALESRWEPRGLPPTLPVGRRAGSAPAGHRAGRAPVGHRA